MQRAAFSRFAFAALLLLLAKHSPAEDAVSAPKAAEAPCTCEEEMWRDLSESPREREIRHKLKEPVTFEFNETPFSDVIAHIQKTHGVPIWIDREGSQRVSLDQSQPVTLKLEGPTLGDAIEILLEQEVGGLTWTIERDLLVVTDTIGLKATYSMRYYDVGGFKKRFGSPPAATAELLSELWTRTNIADQPQPMIKPYSHSILIYGPKSFHREIADLFDLFAQYHCQHPEEAVDSGAVLSRAPEGATSADE